MDNVRNPFTPGAGIVPMEIAGRQNDTTMLETTIRRAMLSKSARSVIFHGLRGVGKTVLLVQAELFAENERCVVTDLEASDKAKLFTRLLPKLDQVVRQLKPYERVKDHLIKAARLIRGLASIFRVQIGDATISVDGKPADAMTATGDIQIDLPDIVLSIGKAAKDTGTAVVLVIDEIHAADFETLDALVTAIHKCNQRQYPVILLGAGLPPCLATLARAKSYSERLFDLRAVGALDKTAAADAVRVPLTAEGVSITDDALALIYEKTGGYPHLIQVWGQAVWNIADGPNITKADVENASVLATHELDHGFFQMRFDLCSKKQKRYLRAIAETGGEMQKTSDIAGTLGAKITSLSSTREALIKKGMIYSPEDGYVAFTVPQFDEFMKRTMAFATWDAP